MNNNSNTYLTLFYNVENLFDTIQNQANGKDEEFTVEGDKYWDEERLQTKLKNLAQAISLFREETPAFFGLAEVENHHVLEQLLNTFPLNKAPYKYVLFNSNDPRGIDCAFVYNPKRIELIDETKHILHLDSDPDFKTRDIIEVELKLRNESLFVFVNHWPSRKEGNTRTEERRIAAATLLRERIDELLSLNPLTNILIMGDFNDTPNDTSIYDVLHAKGQHELKSGDLINLLIEEENDDLGTHVHQGEWMVFDQMIVSQGLLQGRNGLTIEKNNAFIFKHPELLFTYPNGSKKPSATYGGDTYFGGYSDHLPVYLTIQLKN